MTAFTLAYNGLDIKDLGLLLELLLICQYIRLTSPLITGVTMTRHLHIHIHKHSLTSYYLGLYAERQLILTPLYSTRVSSAAEICQKILK